MAERGAEVLGVEVAPRMAEIARRHGIVVEVGAFEDWDPCGRRFDRVTSAQAWHWLDLPVATGKAASVLRPGGRLCLVWNAGSPCDDLADALAEVYARTLPSPVHTVYRGYAAHRSTDRRSGLDSELAAIAGDPAFDAPMETWFPWTQTYRRDEWLEQLLSRSDHTALDPAVQDRLFEDIGATIDDFGGSFVMHFETVLITATRLDVASTASRW
jgi:SAM-dependent methyltransferase